MICLLALPLKHLNAQVESEPEKSFLEVRAYFNQSYGANVNLLNGRQYYLLYSSNSHPFLDSEQYGAEELWLQGKQYEGIPINYDLYKQELVLQYSDYSGVARQLSLNEELIYGFTLNSRTFRKLLFPETGTGYFQVVYAGELSFYFFWEKTMYYSPASNSTPYNYTKASRKAYLKKSGALHAIKSRSSFTQVFDKRYRKDLNRYLRKEAISFKTSSDESIQHLMEYCEELSASPW